MSTQRIVLDHVNAVLPTGWRVVPVRDDRDSLLSPEIALIGPDGPYATIPAGWLTEKLLLEEELVSAAESVLNIAQQWIAEKTAEPWPAISGVGHGTGDRHDAVYLGFPDPGAEISDGKLNMWFGNKQAPVLLLEPVDVSDLVFTE